MSNSPRTVVLGFGVTGQSVARHQCANDTIPVVLDSRSPQPVADNWPGLDVRWESEEWPESLLAQTERAIVSPGMPLHHPLVRQARQANIALLSDIDLFMSEVDVPVIGVTGTNGKSTVVSLVGHLLSAHGLTCAVGGNLGVPALDLLSDVNDMYVLELSSFQLAHSAALPLASAALLNVSDDHRDWHGDFARYQQAKQRIYAAADYCVGTLESELAMKARVAVAPPKIHQWGVADHDGESWIYHGQTPLLPITELPLTGRHNVENCLWALALVEPWIAPPAAAQLFTGFEGLPHRFAAVPSPAHIRCINDSKATNVGAALAALTGFERQQKVILIAGGDSKGADLTPLGPAMQGRVRQLLTLGKNAAELNDVATQYGIAWRHIETMDQAVAAAMDQAEAGDTVLLSPACSSLDMYANFSTRGEHFTQLVAQYQTRSKTEVDA
jgi:UDP-N-acetylmuramoylalanine--D-glutamate ligase